MSTILKTTKPLLWSAAFLMIALITGCGGGGGGGSNTAVPTVTSTVPVAGSLSAATNASLTATFSEVMDPATISTNTFTLQQGSSFITGAVVSYTGKTATFNPTSDLLADTDYTATVTTGAKDLAGDALAVNKVWTFRTDVGADITPPTVTSTVPANVAGNVALNTSVTATFSEVMDPATISTNTFTLQEGASPLTTGTVSYTGTTATFKSSINLLASTEYTATVTTGAKDLAENALATDKTWTFTTGGATEIAAGPERVILGTASDFVILSKAGITTTGSTAVTGDLGVSPIAATAITGFSLIPDGSNTFSTSTLVTGNIYAANYSPPTPSKLTTAISDLEIAYGDAAGRTLNVVNELGAGEIGGLTLVPGLYKWSTNVLISTDVTLSGGPNDVYIFQIAGNLTQATTTSVLLPNGALPENIFWQIGGGSGLTMLAGAHMEGIILSETGIALRDTASVRGRLLAKTAITLINNEITAP